MEQDDYLPDSLLLCLGNQLLTGKTGTGGRMGKRWPSGSIYQRLPWGHSKATDTGRIYPKIVARVIAGL